MRWRLVVMNYEKINSSKKWVPTLGRLRAKYSEVH